MKERKRSMRNESSSLVVSLFPLSQRFPVDESFGSSREAQRSARGCRIRSFKQVAHYQLAFGELRCRAAFAGFCISALQADFPGMAMGFFLEVAFSPFSVIRFWSLLFLFQDDSKPCSVLTLSFTSVYNGTFVKLCSESQSRTGYWAQIQPLCSLVLSSAFSARPKKIIKRRPFSTKIGFCGFICGCAFNISSEFRNTLVFIPIGNYSSLFP